MALDFTYASFLCKNEIFITCDDSIVIVEFDNNLLLYNSCITSYSISATINVDYVQLFTEDMTRFIYNMSLEEYYHDLDNIFEQFKKQVNYNLFFQKTEI